MQSVCHMDSIASLAAQVNNFSLLVESGHTKKVTIFSGVACVFVELAARQQVYRVSFCFMISIITKIN